MTRRERGAAAVEMALVLPVLILLVGGVIDFGRAFMTQTVLTNAAREGTRTAIVVDDTTKIRDRAKSASDGIPNKASITVSVTYKNGSKCGGPTPADDVTVVATVPFTWTMLSIIPGLPASLTGSSTQGC